MFNLDVALSENQNLWSINETTGLLEFKYKDDILTEYQNLFKTLFKDINTDPSTPQGQLITSLTQTDLATISYLESLTNGFFMGGSGYFLDLWAWNLFRVTRKEGIPSSVLVTIEGVAGVNVPASFTITDLKYNYKISTPVTIPASGSIAATFYCTEINDFVAGENTINRMVTIVEGVERVNNGARATPAILKESDGELFQRCVYFGSTARNASFRSILANVAEVQGVNRIVGAENATDKAATISGVTLTPHSICIVVDGGTNEDIANAMFESRATGCAMVGDVKVPISLAGMNYTYSFYRPKVISLKASVKVTSQSKIIPSNFESMIKNTLTDFINNLDINSTITQPLISNALIKGVSGINITDVQFGLKSGNVGYTPITLNLNEVAGIVNADIEVTQDDGTAAKATNAAAAGTTKK